MDDVLLNCILEVCCESESDKPREALTKFMIEYGVDANAAADCAKIMLHHFDLAPRGSLKAFKAAIVKLARGDEYKG